MRRRVELVWPSVGEPLLFISDDDMCIVGNGLSLDEAEALVESVADWFPRCALPVPPGFRVEVFDDDAGEFEGLAASCEVMH